MDPVVFCTFLIGLATLCVFVWRWSQKEAKPSLTANTDSEGRPISSLGEQKEADSTTEMQSATETTTSINSVDNQSATATDDGVGNTSETCDSTGNAEETEVLRVNLESLMEEMEAGSSTLEHEDIKQFQKEAKESLKKAKGHLKKVFMDAITKNGIKGMHDALKEELNRWKNVKLNIAITGASGTGKSSLINTLRGIRPSHPHAANVGVTETTVKPTPYPHPQHDNVVYWDLPGMGTMAFKKDNYVELTDLHDYDVFIIVGCARFTENDAWLASELLKVNRQVYIVRTKIDIDIQNEKTDFAERFQEQSVVERIRQSSKDNVEKLADKLDLGDTIVGRIPIFLISTKLADVKKYDFDDFQKTMTDEIADIKKETMVMALSAFTMSAIDDKMEVIKERFQKVRIALAVALFIPGIQIVGVLCMNSIVDNEVNMYKQQLGIDDESITQRNIDVKNLDLQVTPTSKWTQRPSYLKSAIKVKFIGNRELFNEYFNEIVDALKSDTMKIQEHLNRQLSK